MLCKDLNVVHLNITEDYEYKALFRLCSKQECLDIDLVDVENTDMLNQIKEQFNLEDSVEDIKKILMDKIMKVTTMESRIVEGKK
ncbi:MAG: hypothetical protein PWP27_400 [Clostridiales bacterium]|jgi:hypothetical protein|nr:hypothetical protein [Clostridiales bacterium]MDK2932590.1 hypothetical protein [Clostridiales bacterium]